MFSNSSSTKEDYNALITRLRKKRILKKPNINEALEQFEALASRSESSSEWQVAGMCYKSAARCSASLGQSKHEGAFLLKAARAFLRVETELAAKGYVSIGENLQEALKCFHEAYERLVVDDAIFVAACCLEIANKLSNDLKRGESAVVMLQRAAKLFVDCPMERITCLRQITILLIKSGSYEEALKSCTEAISAAEFLPNNSSTSSIKLNIEIHRLLLLLLVDHPASQVSKREASVLEKLTWIDNSQGDGISDIETTLANAGLPFLPTDLFILLQSLVMAAQSQDTESLRYVEDSLQPHIDENHRELLRVLVKKVHQKS